MFSSRNRSGRERGLSVRKCRNERDLFLSIFIDGEIWATEFWKRFREGNEIVFLNQQKAQGRRHAEQVDFGPSEDCTQRKDIFPSVMRVNRIDPNLAEDERAILVNNSNISISQNKMHP